MAVETLRGALDDVIHGVTEGDWDAISALLRGAEATGEVVVTADNIEAEAGPDAAPAELATDAVGGFVVLVLIAVLLPLIAVAVVLAGAQKLIGGYAIVGGPVGGILGHAVAWLRTIIGHVADMVESDAHKIWRFGRTLFHLWLRFEDVPTRTEVNKAARAESRHFAKWLNHVQSDIARLQHTIHTDENSLSHRLNREQADITYINHELGRVWHQLNSVHIPDVSGLKQSVRKITHQLYDLQNEVNRLEKRPTGKPGHEPDYLPRIKRDEHVVAEMETTIQRLTKRVEQLESRPHGGHNPTQQEINRWNEAHHWSSELAPLLKLAPFTALRLNNLRKLEDKPCQCPSPRLGGTGSGLIDGIVADLVLKDGV